MKGTTAQMIVLLTKFDTHLVHLGLQAMTRGGDKNNCGHKGRIGQI